MGEQTGNSPKVDEQVSESSPISEVEEEVKPIEEVVEEEIVELGEKIEETVIAPTPEEAREIAFNSDKDQIAKAFVFLEDRLRCFLEMEENKNIVTDRWWLDICLNVDSNLLPIFVDFYCTPIFVNNFIGVYLDIDSSLAAIREDYFDYNKIVEEKRKYEELISLLERCNYLKYFKFLSIKVENKSTDQLFEEIMIKVKSL